MCASDVGRRRLDSHVIPLHLGVHPPSHWDDVEARQLQYGEDASPHLQEQRRPPVARPELDWAARGFQPHWIGDDSSECVVAIEPGTFHNHGADEFKRFLRGAERRGEPALVVTTLQDTTKRIVPVFNLFSSHEASGHLSAWNSSINGTVLGKGVRVQPVVGLRGADKDLALRLANEDLRWWTLEVSGSHIYMGTGEERIYPPAGVIEPLLETALGEPVVGAWVSPDGLERRYILPTDVDWAMVADWLAEQALPEFNPNAMRRFRRLESVPPELMTADEERAAVALARFEAEVEERRTVLTNDIASARASADGMRHDLLYGRGDVLEAAVAEVLRSAGITVLALDAALGGTKSADLLCSLGAQRRLVEVKSVGGGASETLYAALLRHLDGWASMPGRDVVEGGVLVLNHEHKKDPSERSRQPYMRPEFLASQQHPVVTSLDLFDAWRVGDTARVRLLVFGAVTDHTVAPAVPSVTAAEVSDPPVAPRRWWTRRG